MRKLFLALAVTVSLGGCASLSDIGTGISIATKSITNPVTRQDEAKIELAVDTALQILLTYRRACLDGAADKNCLANITAIQPYTRQIVPLKDQLRSFVDNNDQINARVVYNQLTTLYSNMKAAAANLGLKIGS